MKKRILIMFACVFMMSASFAHAIGAMPDLVVKHELSVEEKSYLGLTSDTFKLSDIQSDYLFVLAFSMYCPVCQRDAPHINKVYETLSTGPAAEKIKFMGIGLGNNPFEVSVFKKKFSVPFPLVSDGEYAVHKALGEVGTPTYYVLKITNGKVETLHTQQGETEDTDAFISLIKEKIGVQ